MGKEGEMIALEVFKTRPWPASYCASPYCAYQRLTNGPCAKHRALCENAENKFKSIK